MSADQVDELAGLKRLPELLKQSGALAWLPGPAPRQFMIVTSRRTGRWVLPKGNIDPGMTPPKAAQQEAFEEAGVIGHVAAEPLGTYRTRKIRPPHYWEVEVALYPLKIAEVLDVWIEAEQRERRFVTLSEASELLADTGIITLVEPFLARDE